MADNGPGKQIVLIGIITAMICSCALLSIIASMAWPVRRQPLDQPATALTTEQLAQHPLLLYPHATVISISRETKRYGPDEPRPNRSRYLERQTQYQVDATPEDIADFYDARLTGRGWIRCRKMSYPTGLSLSFQSAARGCFPQPDEEIAIFIAVAEGTAFRQVVISETLPSP
jgi:hypothetical protein